MPDFRRLADKARAMLGQHQDQGDKGKAGDQTGQDQGTRQASDQGGQQRQDSGGQSAG